MYSKGEKQCQRKEQVSCIKRTKTSFYTFRRQATAFNHHKQYNIKNRCYFKGTRAALRIADSCHRLIATDTQHSKWLCSYLQRKIVLYLRRIFSQTPLGWRARELEQLGTSLWRRITRLGSRRDHGLATSCAQKKPKKRFWNWVFWLR